MAKDDRLCRRAAKLLLLSGLLTAFASFGDTELRGLGRPADADTIRRIDIDIMPNGHGLPAGEGLASRGRSLYQAQCQQCHGQQGKGGPYAALAGAPVVSPKTLAEDKTIAKTVGNYWPFATTLFDYIRRAMPYDRPGSLSNQAVYDLTAYILYLNDLIDEQDPINATTLPRLTMPAQKFYRSDEELEAYLP